MIETVQIAIYAAVVSTTVLVWDVIKWRKICAVDLRGAAASGMIAIGTDPWPDIENKTFIGVSVANHGNVTCYIEQVGISAFDSWFAYLRGKSSFAAISMDDLSSQMSGKKLPYKLEPGARYHGFIMQTDELVELSRKKRLYLAAHHSLSRKGHLMRVKPIEVSVPRLK